MEIIKISQGSGSNLLKPLTKFTYLWKPLNPKIKHVINSLPFMSEGYNHTKAILVIQHMKESEIIKSFVKEMMELLHILNTNPKNIHEFIECLNHCKQ